MKKFLIVLMVIAMASFLFVGCLGDGIIPDVDDEDEEDEPVLPPSITPVIEKIANVGDEEEDEGIINLYSSATQYMNEDEVADGILVIGVAPKYSEVNIYIGGVVIGTSTAYGGDEEFIVFVAKDNLGDDGAKTLYATTTELGLDESAPSTVYAFTLDTVAPEIVSVAVEAEGLPIDAMDGQTADGTLTVTCSEAIDEDTLDEDPEVIQDIWDVAKIYTDESGVEGFYPGLMVPPAPEYDLTSPEVIGLSGTFGDSSGGFNISLTFAEGDLFRIKYEPSEVFAVERITDLAGNELPYSVHYCYLGLAD